MRRAFSLPAQSDATSLCLPPLRPAGYLLSATLHAVTLVNILISEPEFRGSSTSRDSAYVLIDRIQPTHIQIEGLSRYLCTDSSFYGD